MTRIFLLRFFESYFRHRWLYLLPILLTTLAGTLYLYRLEPKYNSNGIMYVSNQTMLNSLSQVPNDNTNWWVTPAQATGNEINNLIQSNAFVRAIISGTDLEKYMNGNQEQIQAVIDVVRKSLWVTPIGNNHLYTSASFEDPQIAYQMVNSMVTSYVNWQINKEIMNSQVAKDFFEEQIHLHALELEGVRQQLRDYYDSHPAPLRGDRPISEQLEIERLQAEINMVAGRYDGARGKAENANLALQQVESDVRQTYLLLDAPLIPEKPDISRRKMASQLGIFTAVGILMSIIGVAGSTILDRTFRFPLDVQYRLNIPVIAVIPNVSDHEKMARRKERAKQGEETTEVKTVDEKYQPEVDSANGKMKKQKEEKSIDVTA
jgi:capsular polysaccharide biosynthesis protein